MILKNLVSSFFFLIKVINKSLNLSNPQAIMSQRLRNAAKKKDYTDYIQGIFHFYLSVSTTTLLIQFKIPELNWKYHGQIGIFFRY